MTTTLTLTTASHDLFLEFAEDAINWSGHSLINGNVTVSKAQRGNLSDLVQKGLITVSDHNYDDCTWVSFTAAGKQYAAANGVDLDWIN